MKSSFRSIAQQVRLIILGLISFEKYLNYKDQLENESLNAVDNHSDAMQSVIQEDLKKSGPLNKDIPF